MLSFFIALTACAGIETNLRCEDCFEVQVSRIIDGDTLDTSRGMIRLYGVDIHQKVVRGAHQRRQSAWRTLLVMPSG